MENRVRIALGLNPRANSTDIHDIDELPGETTSVKTTGSELVCCGDPVRLWNYREDSRNHEMIVSWNGSYQKGRLTYAEIGHHEYKSYNQPEVLIQTVGLK